MADIIHLLPDSVANQIAAGEVIQRPASIIKELVENALDAGGTRIQVVVEDAGKSLVQVIDNGSGMSETDARLSFERHATSKIRQATDLFALRTMGFRGEALASIAAVAQVELRTRRSCDDLGTSIQIEGSKVICQEPIACPAGANFAVRNLFFNIPARRKFLKSNQTELTNIMSEFERIALAHPDVAFTLHSGTNVMLDLPSGNFRQRIVNIFGRKIDSQLVPVEVDTTLAHIHGFTGVPSASRRKNAHQYLFVNGRYMRHPYFAKAVLMAYERLIPEGQQVPFFINFVVDPSRIDVNIHPTKTEIKFEDDNAIFQILLAAVREALGKFGAVPTIDFDVEARPDIPTLGNGATAGAAIAPPQIHINTAFNPFLSANDSEGSPAAASAKGSSFPSQSTAHGTAPKNWQAVYDQTLQSAHTNHAAPSLNNASAIDGNEEGDSDDFQLPPFPASPTPSAQTDNLYNELSAEERLTWEENTGTDFLQVQGRYIVTPLSSGLALIDQHRAHIRILYEQYRRQLEAHKAPSQRLLFPEMLNLSPSEAVTFEGLLPMLQDVGFDISPLGSGSFSILALPVGTEGMPPSELARAILTDALLGQADAADTVDHIVALALARKVAMPVGQALNAEEMGQLVKQLFACTLPNLTPDGSPTLTVIHPEKML